VALLVAERWIEKGIEVRRFSERVMMVRVLVGKQVIKILSAYAPNVSSKLRAQQLRYMRAVNYFACSNVSDVSR